jgi:hypothetical protein
MWTLILVTFVVSGISTGGVGTTTAFLDFPSDAKCQAAADALAGADQINTSRGNRPNISPSATYRIIAAASSVEGETIPCARPRGRYTLRQNIRQAA